MEDGEPHGSPFSSILLNSSASNKEYRGYRGIGESKEDRGMDKIT